MTDVSPSLVDRTTTAGAIEEAALQKFYEMGYHGASIRAIAKGAGVGVATLFHHYATKAAILEQIINGAADAMQGDLERAVDGIDDPTERLVAEVQTMVTASCIRQRESFVAQSEFRSLNPEAFRVNREKRRRIQALFLDSVEAGIAAGDFDAAHPTDLARSLVLLSSAVAFWYDADQAQDVAEVAERHVEMALNLVAARRT
jgi:AcrR family transcriptional regulator